MRSSQTQSAVRLLPALLLACALGTTPLASQQATIQIKADASGSSTRLVLTHSAEIAYRIQPADGQVEIVYSGLVRAEPAELLLDDPILRRFHLRDGRTLVLVTGSGYRSYEAFELRNPFRLVIDLQGTRSGADAPIALPSPARRGNRRIVVLDPGHGGIEEGAVGPSGLKEKDVTLDLARRLRGALERDPRLQVVLTRDEDRLVGLEERSAIANHNRAVLFLSIHLNSSSRTNARGAETYFLSSEATDDEARTLAALENKSSGVAASRVITVDGERRDLELVLWDLAQNQYLAESSVLAENMQRHLNQLTGTRDRGVRQAPFRVLMGATMPAVLVEVGFVSNAREESKLRSSEYRDQVVLAMTNAVYDFLADLERLSRPAALSGGLGTGSP